MNGFLKCALYLITMVAVLSCKSQPQISRNAHVIGSNDMKVLLPHSSQYKDFERGINASVLLVVHLPENKVKYCSGFVFERREDYIKVLSNHHCFALSSTAAGDESAVLLDNVCEKTKVYFNAVKDLESAIHSAHCVEDTLITNHVADIAVFVATPKSSDGRIPDNIDPINIYDNDYDAYDEESYIIHYPLGKNYVFAPPKAGGERLPAAIITERNCRIVGTYNYRQWEKNPILAVSHKHTCDLTKGSSGSPLISQYNHELVGLNWGGVETTTGKDKEFSNAAIKPSYIHSFLNDHAELDERINSLLAMVRSEDATGKDREQESESSFGCAAFAYGSHTPSQDDHQNISPPAFPYLLWLLLSSPLMLCLIRRKPILPR